MWRKRRLAFILNLVNRLVETYNRQKVCFREKRSHTNTAHFFPAYLPETPKTRHEKTPSLYCISPTANEKIFFLRKLQCAPVCGIMF